MRSDRLSRCAPRLRAVACIGAVAGVTALFSACTTTMSSDPGGLGGSAAVSGGATGSAGGQGGGYAPREYGFYSNVNPAVGDAGTGGRGGSTGGGTGGTTGGGGQGGGAPAAGGSGGSMPGPCPIDATFCSGFESPGMPAGATYRANASPGDWTRDFALDTTVHNGGAASLRVKAASEAGTSGSAYKMLAVPAPSGKFWVRFYVRSSDDLGLYSSADARHNAFAEAAGSDDPNDGVSLEFAEDVGIAFNSHDDDRWPVGFGRTTTGGTVPFTLPRATWHCIEISFDSQARAQVMYINKVMQIDVTGYPMAAQVMTPFTVFRFGFQQYHGPERQMWYDDVVVGPTRTPCL